VVVSIFWLALFQPAQAASVQGIAKPRALILWMCNRSNYRSFNYSGRTLVSLVDLDGNKGHQHRCACRRLAA
jgi:hypothetical protein